MFRKLCIAMLLLATSTTTVFAQSDAILVQSTTSTQNSGLYDYLLPLFTAETGIRVNVVAVGTGQAIRNAANGDADVLLVHAKAAEEVFIADGNGVERFDLMYNDFVLIGPDSDPLNLSEYDNVADALQAIVDSDQIWVSRGDDSGTHKKELSLWADIGVTPAPSTLYRETGSGMGATIRATVEHTGQIVCPHTAVAIKAAAEKRGDKAVPMVMLATAHAAKFPDAVKAATGIHPELPPHMADLFEREERMTRVANDLSAIQDIIRKGIR